MLIDVDVSLVRLRVILRRAISCSRVQVEILRPCVCTRVRLASGFVLTGNPEVERVRLQHIDRSRLEHAAKVAAKDNCQPG
jgi:hypothetical protein